MVEKLHAIFIRNCDFNSYILYREGINNALMPYLDFRKILAIQLISSTNLEISAIKERHFVVKIAHRGVFGSKPWEIFKHTV